MSDDRGERGTRVYVGNLTDKVKKEQLEEEFSRFGKLNSVWLAHNPPGFAFLEFQNKDDADQACESLNGQDVLGSKLRVEISKGRDRGGRGGGRFNDRRGGGGGGFRDRGSGGGFDRRDSGGRSGGFRGGSRGGGGFRSGGGGDRYGGSGDRYGGSGGDRYRSGGRDRSRSPNRRF